MPLDRVFQRFLRKIVLEKNYSFPTRFFSQLDDVEHVRNDYVRDFITDYECLLLNCEWRCLTTVFIGSDNVPVVLTCRNHHKGSRKMMVHTSRAAKHILPSMYADQLAHAVIQCRTVRPMRK